MGHFRQRSVSYSPRALIACLGAIQFAIPLTYVAGGAARINAFLTNDDTYYYLQTAWNARHLGFVTFDGINATNGVQFLWFSILYGLTFLADDKLAFLRITSTAAVALDMPALRHLLDACRWDLEGTPVSSCGGHGTLLVSHLCISA